MLQRDVESGTVKLLTLLVVACKTIKIMIKFYKYLNDFKNLLTISRKLIWSHLAQLLQIQDKLKKEIYATMCLKIKTLRDKEKNERRKN